MATCHEGACQLDGNGSVTPEKRSAQDEGRVRATPSDGLARDAANALQRVRMNEDAEEGSGCEDSAEAGSGCEINATTVAASSS